MKDELKLVVDRQAETPVDDAEGKRYQTPKLSRLGKLSTVTLGGSPGAGDSGNEFTQELPD